LRGFWSGIAASVLLLTAGSALAAGPRTYSYTIEHGDYGTIGTYSDTIEESGGIRRIDTRLRVAVKIIGITMYREDADRTEFWQGDHLLSFHGVTTVNGKPIEIQGEARADGFAITSPTGTVLGPANLYTSSPWSVTLPMPAMVFSTKSGRIEQAQVIDQGETTTSVRGRDLPVRHYEVLTGKRQDVWADRDGVPVHFRTEEGGATVDFILKSDGRDTVAQSRP
jgi:hypothetical protein